MRRKEEFESIPKCASCNKKCKKYIASFLFPQFEEGKAELFCKRFESNKIGTKTKTKK